MDSKSVVVVSRFWNNPNILVWVNNESIGMGMKLDDFLVALSEEIGNPAFLLTKAQMLQKMRSVTPTIESEMKDATIKVAF
jgi:hypothetical protein